ncbi:uncharacterized protein N7458_005017 [Penicillium daleae]|uniref:Uncharacterized protein n=1 Tax=Penicillium daleae TaxID=63821 RepID=A0AAD6G351_9EURO|nr:uncharacterized protein N7458_005017 [Penicillium daleae]KAJ5454061.1 hypothetical protein N7458_005017 [Penicillium daleae]
MEVKFYGSQNNRATVAPLAYTGSPWKLFISDILLFLQWSPYLINIVLPLWPCPSRCLDELYPSLANIHDILLHTILVVAQSSFLVSLPFLITIPFVFYIFYIGLFLALNMSVCNLLNGKIPEEGLKSTEDEHSEAWKRHDDESWIFLNGVAVGKHWLQSNIDRISRTFHRPVVGVHNRTNGIIFDVIECLIQRALLYSNSDIRQCHMLIKKALYAPGIKKVVLILHSQGGIEGGMILDWLYDEVPHDLLKQLEVYTFGNAANHFNNPYRVNIPGVGAGVGSKHTSAYLQTQNKRAVAHIEHYANRKDFVSRWGVLHFTRKVSEDPLQNRFMGRVFERPGGGHQFNQHYLDNMFPLDPTGRFVRGLADGDFMEMDVWVGGDTEAREGLGQSLEATSGSIEPESRVLSSSPSSVWTESQEQTSRPQGNFMISVVDELARTNGVPLKALKVKNLSRLWAYCNGDSPTDIITEAVIKEPAENKGGERPVTDLPDPGEGITITEEILKAARNEHTGERLVTVLLDRRRDEISITEEVIKAVAANRRSATKLMTLILESDVKFSDEYHWAREVGIVGYSSQEIADLLLEDLHDSPWIFFEPTYVDHGKFEANRHIPECCHHCLAHPPGPTQFIEYQSTTVDHEDIIEEIQELCGLAGISPTTRNVTDWIGSIEFGAGNHVGAVSFTLPCDGNNLLDTQIIYTRISQALKGSARLSL